MEHGTKNFAIEVLDASTGQRLDFKEPPTLQSYLGYFSALKRKGYRIDSEVTKTVIRVSKKDDLFGGL